MKPVRITENLVDRYRKIGSIISVTSEGRKISYSSFFRTGLGKKLGKNIDHIQEFSLKGIFTIFPFNKFIQALEDLYSDERYLKELRKSGATESDLGFIEFIKDEIFPKIETNESDQLFTEVDERVFMGALVTSLYALIDGYSKDALSIVINIKDSPRRILQNLGSPLSFSFREVEKIADNPDEHYRTLAFEAAKNRSVKDRLRLIKSGTGIWDCIQSAAKSTGLSDYELHFEDFIDLRHEIAHQNPIPTEQDFLHNTPIANFVQQLRERFKQSLEGINLPPDVLSEVFNVLMDWMDKRQIPLGIILQLTTMATIYPALIDNALGLIESI